MFTDSRPRLGRLVGIVATVPLLAACSLFGYPSPLDPGPAPGARSAPRASESYQVHGRRYTVLATAHGYRETGIASWYGDEFAGRPTSSGEIFDPDGLTAAHRSLPLATWVEVTNLENGRHVRVRINDRGPFADVERRIIDLSREAARRLEMVGPGTARVEVRALGAEEASRAREGG